ncbi:hypothetical protein CDD82_6561 [Ophiocordyceps australis]|uniref:Uncharacterized protein n=1 Tax=Ophiocordyceps australis TaxID=1399860 RepID=A0A2C5ZQX6_9HYPO|nr:hypothetical protein CDD82_6561 [Ophiocordyceps australis]
MYEPLNVPGTRTVPRPFDLSRYSVLGTMAGLRSIEYGGGRLVCVTGNLQSPVFASAGFCIQWHRRQSPGWLCLWFDSGLTLGVQAAAANSVHGAWEPLGSSRYLATSRRHQHAQVPATLGGPGSWSVMVSSVMVWSAMVSRCLALPVAFEKQRRLGRRDHVDPQASVAHCPQATAVNEQRQRTKGGPGVMSWSWPAATADSYPCCRRPEYRRPEYRRPEYRRPEYRRPEYLLLPRARAWGLELGAARCQNHARAWAPFCF